MAVFKGLEFATKIAEHQEDISSMLNSFDSQSNLLEWLILSKEERDYVADMSYQGYIHLVFQCVVTILHIFLAMPSNAFTLMVIAKNKSLWTFSNMVFVINAFFMALASASNCMFRLSHFPLIFFSEQNRIIAYRVGWWTNFVYFRIGNFSLLLLAFIRYAMVCLGPSAWCQKYVKVTPSMKVMITLLVLLLIPSILWTIIMDLGSAATGVAWSFKPGANISDISNSVIAFQVIGDKERKNTSKAVVSAMGGLLLLQLVLTLLFYAKICYVSVMSTMRLALKSDLDNSSTSEDNTNKDKVTQDDGVLSECQQDQTTPRIPVCEEASSISISRNEHWNAHDTDNTNLNHHETSTCNTPLPICLTDEKTRREIVEGDGRLEGKPFDSPQLTRNKLIDSPDLSNDDPDAIFTISSEVVRSNDREATLRANLNVTKSPTNLTTGTESFAMRPRPSSNISSKQKRPRKKKKRSIIPKAEDYKPHLPISEARLVNIPLTSAVICVTPKDIICTASLSLQVLCLLATHFLSMYTYRISGKEVPLETYMSGLKAWEISVLMITMVDPLSCVIFSSSYREGAKNILLKIFPKENKTQAAK